MPTYKDVDFRNNLQKVYVTEEEKEKLMEKLNRDVEVKHNHTFDTTYLFQIKRYFRPFLY